MQADAKRKIQRILLIQPPWYRLFGSGVTVKIPLGLCYMSAVLNKNGLDASVYDAEFASGESTNLSIFGMTKNIDSYLDKNKDLNMPVWKNVEKKIREYNPDAVGISVKTPTLRSGLNIAKICKKINPQMSVIMGGVHASCLPKQTVSFSEVDFVVIGEGEYTLVDLIKRLNSGADINDCPGIAYKNKNGEVVINSPRKLIANLDELPVPDRDNLLDKNEYPKDSYGEIFTGRGCPYSCIFCASKSIWGQKTRHRTSEKVVEEIELVHRKYGTGYFCIEDDTFMMDKKKMNEFCDLLIKKKLPIKWDCETRVNLVTEEALKKIKDAGCVLLNVGVESGSDETLKKIKKGITVNQIEKAFKLIRRAKIPVSAFIMIGFPWEKKEDMIRTVDFAQSLSPQRLVLSVVTPYPGIELFDICNAQYNMQLDENCKWEEFFHQSNKVVLPDMDKKEFHDLVEVLEKRVMNYTTQMRFKSAEFWKARFSMYLKRPKKIIDDITSLVKQI
ncbi:MAG: radical SAM protein [Candidatus Omnitrophota bacterium]